MRKLAAISLLSLFLFNLIGYRAVFYFAQAQLDKQLEFSFDHENYDESALIAITIPLSNPYQLSHPDFERVDGEVIIHGASYKYVKRKVSGSEIVLLCLPNDDKTKLLSASTEYFKFSNDIAQTNQGKKNETSKKLSFSNFFGEFDTNDCCRADSTLLKELSSIFRYQHRKPVSTPHLSPDQPPEA